MTDHTNTSASEINILQRGCDSLLAEVARLTQERDNALTERASALRQFVSAEQDAQRFQIRLAALMQERDLSRFTLRELRAQQVADFDRAETAEAHLAAMKLERDAALEQARLGWNRAGENFVAMEYEHKATEARLAALAAALERLEQEICAAQSSAYEVAGPKSLRGHDYKRWADRLAALRTGTP